MIIKTYFEEIFFLLIVLAFCICSIILCINFSKDSEEKKCVEFYLKNNYILNSCNEYKNELEAIKK